MTVEEFNALVDQSDYEIAGSIGMDAEFERGLSQLRVQKRALATARDLMVKDEAAIPKLMDEGLCLNDEFQTKARALLDEAVTSGAATPLDP